MIRYIKRAEDAPLLPPPPEPHKEEAGLSRATLAGIVGAGVAGYVRNKKEEIKAGKRSWGDVGVGALVGTGFGSMMGYGVTDSLLRSARRGPDSLLRGVARHHGARRGASIAAGLVGGGLGAIGGAILAGGKSRPRAAAAYPKEASALPAPSAVLPVSLGHVPHAVKPSTIAKAVKSMKPMAPKIAKEKEDDPAARDNAVIGSAVKGTAIAAGVGTLGGVAAGISGAHEKPMSLRNIAKMKRKMGVKGVPIVKNPQQHMFGPGLGQMFSAYASPDVVEKLHGKVDMPERARKRGVIFSHTGGAPSIIAHEMGHAGPTGSKLQKASMGVYGYSKAFGIAGGGAAGGYIAKQMARKGEDPKTTARRGMIAGGIGGLIGGGPMIAEEARASYRAMKGLKAVGHGPKQLLHAGLTLGAAGATYLASAAGGGAAVGGPTAVLSKKRGE